MSALELIALASSVSLLAGWRLYLVTLVTGLAMKFGWVAMPEQLHALDVLASNWVIGIAAVGTLAEFFADKIAWVDSAWDAIHSVVRPLAAPCSASPSSIPATPASRSPASCSAAARPLSPMPARPGRGPSSTPSPEPFSNVVVSTGEDIATGGLLALAIANPIAAAIDRFDPGRPLALAGVCGAAADPAHPAAAG